jgi:quercetin dioxygenase-like cupin family protein
MSPVTIRAANEITARHGEPTIAPLRRHGRHFLSSIPVQKSNAMHMKILAVLSVAIAMALAAMPRPVRSQEQVKPVFDHAIPNIKGKSMLTVVVTYPPGAKSMSHRHARSAFIYAYVLSGSIRSKVDNQPTRIYRAGESFYEEPGSHHVISENASESETASLLAVFVVDSKDRARLTTPDSK